MSHRDPAAHRKCTLASYYRRREQAIATVKRYYQANKARILAAAKERYSKDPVYRARVLALSNARAKANGSGKSNWKKWKAKNPDKVRAQSRDDGARRRAKIRGAAVGEIDYGAILRKANGRCGICQKPFDLFGIEFDHIVPLARGGAHTQDNLQATHAYCNRRKGTKVA